MFGLQTKLGKNKQRKKQTKHFKTNDLTSSCKPIENNVKKHTFTLFWLPPE